MLHLSRLSFSNLEIGTAAAEFEKALCPRLSEASILDSTVLKIQIVIDPCMQHLQLACNEQVTEASSKIEFMITHCKAVSQNATDASTCRSYMT